MLRVDLPLDEFGLRHAGAQFSDRHVQALGQVELEELLAPVGLVNPECFC